MPFGQCFNDQNRSLTIVRAFIQFFSCLFRNTSFFKGTPKNQGVNQRAVAALFEDIEARRAEWEYSIEVSMLEIYNESIR